MKFRNSVLKTVGVLKEATVGCPESRLVFFSMNEGAVPYKFWLIKK